MICRICIVCVNTKETLDYKLHFLLGLIYERMFYEEHMIRTQWRLYPVDEELRWITLIKHVNYNNICH